MPFPDHHFIPTARGASPSGSVWENWPTPNRVFIACAPSWLAWKNRIQESPKAEIYNPHRAHRTCKEWMAPLSLIPWRTAVLHLTDTLYVILTSWREVKTSAASLDRDRKHSENSNSWTWAPITISTWNTTESSTLEQKNRTVAHQFSPMTQRTLSTKDREVSWGMWNWKVLFRDGLESQAFNSSEKLGYLFFCNRFFFFFFGYLCKSSVHEGACLKFQQVQEGSCCHDWWGSQYFEYSLFTI